jgi:hypothetical protein
VPIVHRSRTREGKDGNPLNEVRVLYDSVAENDGIFCVQKVITYDAAQCLLGLQVGDRVALTEADFTRRS